MTVIMGDCVAAMRDMQPDSVDAIVTDPPYGLGFMGAAWDNAAALASVPRGGVKDRPGGPFVGTRTGKGPKAVAFDGHAFQQFSEAWAREAWRVLKPGGHLLAFGGTRTYHRMACAIEDAGFEIRDCLQWLYGSGFPKSHNLTGEHAGKGTALKPANEPIVLARKPLAEKTVAANVLAWGTGALNIDAGRIVRDPSDVSGWSKTGSHESENRAMSGKNYERDPKPDNDSGRWPANVLLGETAAELLDEQSGQGVSRFFYVAKASRKERNAGLESLPDQYLATMGDGIGKREHNPEQAAAWVKNNHPTVKPIALMRYLIRLVTPPGGTVLDPFAGSGTTGVACAQLGIECVLIEKEAEYVTIIERRLQHAREAA